MAISTSPTYRAAAVGVVAAALIIGAFSLGASRGGSPSGGAPAANAATLTAAQSAGRITVTGTGTVTGVPNQLVLAMGVQVNAYSVTSALTQANTGVRKVTAALRNRGVARSDIQTSDLNISPNYNNNGGISGYSVSESLTATLNQLGRAGAEIEAAVHAGGNAVTVDDVSLNLTSTGHLMAAARASAVANAKAQAQEFASALNEPLGPVISISPVQQQPVTPLPFGDNTASALRRSVPISPGTQQLSVSITVVYAT
jgi:uncharacterized protein